MHVNIAINWLNNNEIVPNPKDFQLVFLSRNKGIEKEMPFVGKATKSSCTFPAGNYMFKVNNRNTRTRCEICSKLTIKTPERRYLYPLKTSENLWFSDVFRGYRWRRSGVFIVNFEHISHLVLVFLLLTLSR